MSLTIQHKRGATWHYAQFAALTDRDDQLLDMTGVVIKSQIRNGSALVAELECEWESPVDQVFTHYFDDTSAWPVGKLTRDVRFEWPGGGVSYLQTEFVDVVESVTKGTP